MSKLRSCPGSAGCQAGTTSPGPGDLPPDGGAPREPLCLGAASVAGIGVMARPSQSTVIPKCEHIWWISASRFVATLLPQELSQSIREAAPRIPDGSVRPLGVIFSDRTKTNAAEKSASKSKNPNFASPYLVRRVAPDGARYKNGRGRGL